VRVAVVRFPGSNCDADAWHAARAAGAEAVYVWHRSADLEGADVVVLPGGFCYGDYLRPGAIARFSPVMKAVAAHAAAGRPVLGICNGFQVLCEAQLLPGALARNGGLSFVCRPVTMRVESDATPFTARYKPGQLVTMPVAHGDGRYVADPATLDRLEREERVVFRYVGGNPNGAMRDIAGITNEGRNVVGLMPHPERAAEALLGSDDGAAMFALAGVAAGV
jgi:phosphoribosylformylglycinamidine synthase